MKMCSFCFQLYLDKGYGQCCSKRCHNRLIRRKRKNEGHNKYDHPDYIRQQRESSLKQNENQYGKLITEERKCAYPECEELFTVIYREFGAYSEQKYCSKRCSAIHIGQSTAEKTAETLREMAKNDENHGFRDSKKREIALIAADKALKSRSSSKGERSIRKSLKEMDTNWKAHRLVETKAVDLKNNPLKIIFEYDGPTHFRVVYTEAKFKSQQEKDKNVYEWCKNSGWRLFRISEQYFIDVFRRNSDKVVENMIEFIDSDDQFRFLYTGNEENY